MFFLLTVFFTLSFSCLSLWTELFLPTKNHFSPTVTIQSYSFLYPFTYVSVDRHYQHSHFSLLLHSFMLRLEIYLFHKSLHHTGFLPGELFSGFAAFLSECVLSENGVSNFVSRHCIYFIQISSPIALNSQLCCARYNMPLLSLSCINRNLVWHYTFCELYLANVLYDMLLVRSKQTVISVLCSTDADFVIDSLWAS